MRRKIQWLYSTKATTTRAAAFRRQQPGEDIINLANCTLGGLGYLEHSEQMGFPKLSSTRTSNRLWSSRHALPDGIDRALPLFYLFFILDRRSCFSSFPPIITWQDAMRWSSPDEVVWMNDHLISRLLMLLQLMLLNRLQLMLLLRVVLHLSTNVCVNARIVVIHYYLDHFPLCLINARMCLFTFYCDDAWLAKSCPS